MRNYTRLHKKKSLTRYLEPSIIITFVTGIIYIMGYMYYISFCNQLSIPSNALEMPFMCYLIGPIHIVFLIFLIFAIYSFENVLLNRYFLKSRLYTFVYSIVLVVVTVVPSIIIVSYLINPVLYNFLFVEFNLYTQIVAYSILATTILVGSIMQRPLFNDIYSYLRNFGNQITIIAILIPIIIASAILTGYAGHYTATMLIEGRGFEVSQLELSSEYILPSNTTFLFVTYEDRNYYLVKKCDTKPEHVEAYIIPDNQVKMMVIENCGTSVYLWDKCRTLVSSTF